MAIIVRVGGMRRVVFRYLTFKNHKPFSAWPNFIKVGSPTISQSFFEDQQHTGFQFIGA